MFYHHSTGLHSGHACCHQFYLCSWSPVWTCTKPHFACFFSTFLLYPNGTTYYCKSHRTKNTKSTAYLFSFSLSTSNHTASMLWLLPHSGFEHSNSDDLLPMVLFSQQQVQGNKKYIYIHVIFQFLLWWLISLLLISFEYVFAIV